MAHKGSDNPETKTEPQWHQKDEQMQSKRRREYFCQVFQGRAIAVKDCGKKH